MPFTRLLVPLDGSHQAEQALPYVRWLAKGLRCRVELLSVTEPVDSASEAPASESEEDRAETGLHGRVHSYLDGIAADLTEGGLDVTVQIIDSNPVFQIIAIGEQSPGTLIVMPTRGHYSPERWPVDSVTAKVLHGTIAPVLVIPTSSDGTSRGEAKLSTMIVPLDGSQHTERVVIPAVSLAGVISMSLTLVTVHATSEVDASSEGVHPVHTGQGSADYLREAGERLDKEGVTSIERRVLDGDPVDAILRVANEAPDSLVAMATHGHSEVTRLIIGSVTDEVVRRAIGPVMVVRSPE